jgi:hypothetical protein
VYLSERSYQELQQLANMSSRSMSQVVVAALRFYSYAIEVRQSGGRLVAEREGRQRELVSV